MDRGMRLGVRCAVVSGLMMLAGAARVRALTTEELLKKDAQYQQLLTQVDDRKKAVKSQYACDDTTCNQAPEPLRACAKCDADKPGCPERRCASSFGLSRMSCIAGMLKECDAAFNQCKAACVQSGGKAPLSAVLAYDAELAKLQGKVADRQGFLKTQYGCDDKGCKITEGDACSGAVVSATGITANCGGTQLSCTFRARNGKLVCD